MNRAFSKSHKFSASFELTGRNEKDGIDNTEEIDVNLRGSCLACAFVSSCTITEEKASPDLDVLLGSYRFPSLKERCLI